MNLWPSTLVLLIVATLIAGCATETVQPAAGGLRASEVATIVTSQGSKISSAALGRVTDSQGKDVVNFNMFAVNSRNSVIVIPGTYRIGLVCPGWNAAATPSATFELRGGYTYVMKCARARGSLWVNVTATEEPTLSNNSDAQVH